MELNIENLLVGVLVGGALASLIWVITVISNKNRIKKEKTGREILINSIGDKLVEIDALLSSCRTGLITSDAFKSDLEDKLYSINKEFKPNLYKFDVYYVKYVDTLIDRYRELAKQEITPFHYDNKAEFEQLHSESDPLNSQDTQTIERPSETPQESGMALSRSTTLKSQEDSVLDTVKPTIEDSALKPDSEVSSVGQESFSVKPVEDADIPEFLPIDGSELSKDELEHESKEIAKASIPKDQKPDSTFELMAKDEITEGDKKSDAAADFSSMMHNKKPLGSPEHSSISKSADHDEEDFSMETIQMEVDPATSSESRKNIPESKSGDSIRHAKTQEIKKDIVKSAFEKQKKHIEAAATTPKPAASQTSSNIYMPLKSTPSIEDEEEVVFEKKPDTDVSIRQSKSSKKFSPRTTGKSGKSNVNITGDDVADKIDTFFGIDK